MIARTCHDPVVHGHRDLSCPLTAVPPAGYSGAVGCTPDCRVQHAMPSTAIEDELATAGQL